MAGRAKANSGRYGRAEILEMAENVYGRVHEGKRDAVLKRIDRELKSKGEGNLVDESAARSLVLRKLKKYFSSRLGDEKDREAFDSALRGSSGGSPIDELTDPDDGLYYNPVVDRQWERVVMLSMAAALLDLDERGWREDYGEALVDAHATAGGDADEIKGVQHQRALARLHELMKPLDAGGHIRLRKR